MTLMVGIERIDGGPAGLAGHCDFLDLPATAARVRFLHQVDERFLTG